MELPGAGRTLRLTCVASARQTALGILAAMLLVALNVAWVARALGPPPHRPREVLELDHRRYIAMAGAFPGASADSLAREAPFCWRILSPLLVYGATRAGFDLHFAYWASTLLFLILFLFALFRYLLGLGFDTAGALLGMTLASLMPGAVRWYAYQYWMPDPLCLFLVVLGLHLVERHRHTALSFVALAGLLTRESWMLVIVYALVRWIHVAAWRTSLRRGLAVFGLPLLAFAALRLWIMPQSGPTLLGAAREMLAFRARHLFENQLYFATLGSFGVLVPLLLARAGRVPGFVRRHPESVALVAMTYGSLAFANNTDRLLVYALPVLIPAALGTLLALGAKPRDWALWAATALSLQLFVYVLTPFRGSPGLSMLQPVQWPVVAALAGFWLACIVAPRLRRVGG